MKRACKKQNANTDAQNESSPALAGKFNFLKVKRIFKGSRVWVFGLLLVALLSAGFIAFGDKDFKIGKNLDIFFTLFRELNIYYVDDTDPEKLINAGIEGMLTSLDPYTKFIPEKEMDDFRFMTTGEYGGIGALIRKAGKFTMIAEPYKGFPAYKAGLLAGDTLLFINGVSVMNKEVSDVSILLKGTPNTPLRLKLRRLGHDSIIEKTLVREKIIISNVPYAGIIDKGIGYIRVANFTKDAGAETKEAMKRLKGQGAQSVIVDLRNNPGGLLVESVNIANLFVEKGIEIVSTRGRVKQWDNTYLTEDEPVDTKIPMVVLVSRGSASAAEIVAGALQDLDRAVIVGTRTFGKGLVQATRPLSYNTQLKVTTAKYYIPSGRCIQALDYTHINEDGSVGYIPDSLITAFKTKNGRTVFDGGGILPDMVVEQPQPSRIAVSLYTKNFIFDFATLYRSKYPQIGPMEEFTCTDEIFDEFVAFLQDKPYDYTTKSDDKLSELIAVATSERYYDVARDEFEALKKRLAHDKNKDLETFKKEIMELLTEEIASRYYFQEGRIRSGLTSDNQVATALQVLNDMEGYKGILQSKNTSRKQ